MHNPVFSRELRLILRNTPLFHRIIGGWTVLAVIIFILWPESGIYSSEAQSSRLVFKVFAMGQLLMILLVAPAITAPLITDEKEKERFGMLFASLLTPFDILIGKWFSSFIVQMILLITGLPFLVLTLALGGVSWGEIFQVYVISFLTLLQFGLMGLFFSCIKAKTYTALIHSYAWLLVWVAVTWLPSYLLGSNEMLAIPLTMLRSLSPFSAMMDVISPEVLIYLGRLPREWALGELWSADLVFFIGASLLASVAFFVMSLKKIFSFPLGKDVRSQVREVDAKKKKFPYWILNPEKRRKPFGVGSLIFVKELRCKMFGNLSNLIRGVWVGFSVSMVLVILVTMNIGVLDFEPIRVVAVAFQLTIILLLAPALTASSISEEVTHGTLDMLRMTPVSAFKVWIGKVKASTFYLLILLISSFPIYGLFLLLEIVLGGNPWMVLEIVAIQSVMLLFATSCGVWCSAITGQTQKAIGLSYLILFVLVGLPFALPNFLEQGPVLDWLVSLSSYFVCIRQASTDLFKEFDVFIKHFITLAVLASIMIAHSLFIVRGMMRQAR